jgi:hypothetical protein
MDFPATGRKNRSWANSGSRRVANWSRRAIGHDVPSKAYAKLDAEKKGKALIIGTKRRPNANFSQCICRQIAKWHRQNRVANGRIEGVTNAE